jgi:hypothetical protein
MRSTPVINQHVKIAGEKPNEKKGNKMITADEYRREQERDREYWLRVFAGQAMQGLLANCGDYAIKQAAQDAVEYAEALLKELEKE